VNEMKARACNNIAADIAAQRRRNKGTENKGETVGDGLRGDTKIEHLHVTTDHVEAAPSLHRAFLLALV